MMTTPAIRTDNLTRQYKTRLAVDRLNLSADQGAFLSLLGQNGAGKTTTVKMLCCLLAPTSGDAHLLGESIRAHPDAVKRRINLSPQETAVALNLTVRENLEFIARLYGADRRAAREKAAEYIALLGLEGHARDRAKVLSGGMQRRLSIAMALITGPEILFLDEPTLGLDVRARRDLWKLIAGLKDRVTIVLTTHYMEEAEALSDQVAILHKGRLVAQGTPRALMDRTGCATFEDAYLALTDEEEEAL